jgi:hypothetical protein
MELTYPSLIRGPDCDCDCDDDDDNDDDVVVVVDDDADINLRSNNLCGSIRSSASRMGKI